MTTILEKPEIKELLSRIQGGEGVRFGGRAYIYEPENLFLGSNVYIGDEAYINCMGSVTIGSNTILSRRCTIYSYDHNFKDPACLPYDGRLVKKPVRIGSYVWVGMNVTIAPGTVIGDGAVIGIGTVLSGIIPENAIVVGAKHRIAGYRNEEHTKRLVNEGLYYF